MNKTLERTNRFIHEAIHGGGSWVKSSNDDSYFARRLKEYQNPNYLEHNSDWTKMVKWSMEQSWWRKFKMHIVIKGNPDTPLKNDEQPYQAYIAGLGDGSAAIADLFTDPKALATAIMEYLEGRDE